MSNYEYSSFQSSSSGGGGAGGYGGFDVTKAMFNQADINRDGTIDRNEFQQWASGIFGVSSGFADGYSGSSGYESYGSGSQGLEAGFGGSSYDSSLYSSDDYAGGADFSGGYGADGYNVSASGLYQDSNPQIIRRPAPGGPVTYKQNILVRFLQPPPVPPPGEVRPPQPPPPPPLRIRQQAPARPSPPPLILRERPPIPPQSVQSQTVIRRLAPLPVPPRSVIIERLPPLPPKPRDIIIERWIPYGRQAKRRVIVQRAAAQQYVRPRNIIIQYEPIQVRVVRQFQRLGVQQENPHAYVARFGASLRDAQTLLQEARQAGVVEDISPPVGGAIGFGAQSYGQDIGYSGGAGFSGGADFAQSSYGSQSGYDLGFGGGFGGSASGFENVGGYGDQGGFSGYESSQSYGGGFGGGEFDSQGAAFQGGYDAGFGGGQYSSSSFESSSYGEDLSCASQTGSSNYDIFEQTRAGSAGFSSGFESGLGAVGSSTDYGVGYDANLSGISGSSDFGGQFSSQSYESSAAYEGSAGGYGGASYGGSIGGFDPIQAAFNRADANRDGTIDQNEFRQFFQGGL
ncbi:unnamed protein product [Didymodactylos carnosus]|uniref:EF-hand domain-containing protein n=1 Tax=Didymodactylos carnosus TaxID=1234261 RepID=A0A8S2CTY9_9BILA|nr:unnamed protein product [Didymodactylos carnosus]CAF3517982.1 unnamed protein product [Didymodactylos carnosus]